MRGSPQGDEQAVGARPPIFAVFAQSSRAPPHVPVPCVFLLLLFAVVESCGFLSYFERDFVTEVNRLRIFPLVYAEKLRGPQAGRGRWADGLQGGS